MPRGKRIVIERNNKDPVIQKIKAFKVNELKTRRKKVESELYSNISQIVKSAQMLYEQDKLDKARIRNLGLLSVDEAFEEVKRAGLPISSRAFGGRVERRSIHSEKIGKKRLIPKPVIHDWISLHNDFYSVKEAFELLKLHEAGLNLRAFIGRVEKNAIPSIKINTQRWIPKDIVDSMAHVSKNYYDVSQAIDLLSAKGLKIRRNAFERRLDRNRIPHEKIGGRRVIARDVVEELATKEMALAARKSGRI
ncbi:MAG: hypothetical protein V1822_03780 [Candidatus Micrarchaeota archaeon]